MSYVIAAIAVLLIALVFGFSRAHPEEGRTGTSKKAAAVSEVQSMKQSEIEERLRELAKGPPPAKLSPGAMCYSMMVPPTIVEYVCPKCGEKTLYTGEKGPRSADDTNAIRREVVACRRILKEMEGLDIELDESQFCAKCTPDLKGPPQIILVVRYEGTEEPHRVEGVTSEDMAILKEFLDGKDKHEGDFGIEKPLKDYIERLGELLGVKIEEHVDETA
jgi:hypothetical protein